MTSIKQLYSQTTSATHLDTDYGEIFFLQEICLNEGTNSLIL